MLSHSIPRPLQAPVALIFGSGLGLAWLGPLQAPVASIVGDYFNDMLCFGSGLGLAWAWAQDRLGPGSGLDLAWTWAHARLGPGLGLGLGPARAWAWWLETGTRPEPINFPCQAVS